MQNPNIKSKILFVSIANIYPSWFDDFFRLMGIEKERIVYVKQPTQCRSVTIPDQSQYWESYTKEWFLTFQAIKSHVTPGESKKLYLTRTKFDATYKLVPRHCFNENYFEDFFAARGFEIVSMEELSLDKQISLIMGADEVAATMGTLTHFAMFCKPTAKFIMLNREHNDDTPFQRIVNNVFENYYIVDVCKTIMYAIHSSGLYLLGSTKYWKDFVADYFGEYIEEDDDISYLEDSLDKYVDSWCLKYQNPENMEIWVESLSDMCHRIISLERELSKGRPLLKYLTHVSNIGWGRWQSENSFSNPLDQMRNIQAIRIEFSGSFHNIYYSVYFNEKEGWSQEVSTSEIAGTVGKSKPIRGIKIRLDENGTKEFDIFYRVYKSNGEWTPWVSNGAELYTRGLKLNAIQIKLESKVYLQWENQDSAILQDAIMTLHVLKKSLASKNR